MAAHVEELEEKCIGGKKWKRNFLHSPSPRSPARGAPARLARAGDRAAAGGFSCPGREARQQAEVEAGELRGKLAATEAERDRLHSLVERLTAPQAKRRRWWPF